MAKGWAPRVLILLTTSHADYIIAKYVAVDEYPLSGWR